MCLEIQMERKRTNGKNKVADTFRLSLFLSFHFRTLWLSEPFLVVWKVLVALNAYFYEQRIK